MQLWLHLRCDLSYDIHWWLYSEFRSNSDLLISWSNIMQHSGQVLFKEYLNIALCAMLGRANDLLLLHLSTGRRSWMWMNTLAGVRRCCEWKPGAENVLLFLDPLLVLDSGEEKSCTYLRSSSSSIFSMQRYPLSYLQVYFSQFNTFSTSVLGRSPYRSRVVTEQKQQKPELTCSTGKCGKRYVKSASIIGWKLDEKTSERK